MRPILFLDMDGVIVNPPDGRSDLWNEPDFWWDLPKFDWSDDLVYVCCRDFQVHILSSIGGGPASAHGKMKWLGEHYPDLVSGAIFTRRKELLSGPRRVLLDDDSFNTWKFREWGGLESAAILFPRPHNELYRKSHDPDNLSMGRGYKPDDLQGVYKCLATIVNSQSRP